jgi:membrane-bound lytic murein transglycosylase B
MKTLKRTAVTTAIAAVMVLAACDISIGATCGNTSSGFNQWKADFVKIARKNGVKKRGLEALSGARYSTSTIAADRNQKGVKYALRDFIRIRLGSLDSFANTGRREKARNAAFYASLEKKYGVPAGVLIAIHGMETGFGRTMGRTPVIDSILTVAYDCRRSDFFIPHAIAALRMVDKGSITGATRGAAHGELGHTQFLPGNALKYGVDANRDGKVDFYSMADALASTANFLRKKGWKPGQPYQEGSANFRVLNDWNAATVYQQAIALSGARIDG